MEGVIARKGRLVSIAATIAVGLALLVPAGANAHKITGGPTISGIPQESRTLTASATWTGDPLLLTVTWTWQRCLATDVTNCKAIAGANASTYVVAAADVGSVLRVRLKVTASSTDSVTKRSAPTTIIQPASAPQPPPLVTREPEPDDPSNEPAEPFNSPADSVIGNPPPIADGLRVMNPFPVVRISGRLTGSGADVKRLSVRAPRGATISVRCRGGSCPARTFARATKVKRLSAYERHLRGGTKLDIVVRKPGRVGKWTTITIRRGAPPKRVDRCSYPGRGQPAACPAA